MTIVRNILAIIIGLAVGSGVNMSLIILGPNVIAPPAGVDFTDGQSLAEFMHLMEAKHFVFPFLAHALGTLAGALAAYLVAASHRTVFAYIVGGAFLAGGIAAAAMFGGPVGFIVLDLVVAYIPMAWLAVQLGRRIVVSDAPA